jgi:hypothetical protein
MIFVSCDVGRSTVKVGYDLGKPEFFLIPSFVATSFSRFSAPESSMVNSYSDQDVAQLVVKSTQGGWNKDFASFFLFGRQAQKQGRYVNAFSEGPQFHKYGVAITLFCVARAVSRSTGDRKVSLAINLTYSNNDAVSFYGKSLKGKHSVLLGKVQGGRIVDEEVSFEITDLYCFQQGYASLFNFIGTKDFDLVRKGTGVVMDVGRHTVDFSKADGLTLVDGRSIDFGTRHLIDEFISSVSESHHIKLRVEDVENSFVNHDMTVGNMVGDSIRPWDLIKGDPLDGYYQEIKAGLNNFVGEEPIDFLVLCGGGANLIKDRFVKDFKVRLLSLDFLRANVSGMLKMMMVR